VHPSGSYCGKVNLSVLVYETVHFYFNNTGASYVRNFVSHRETGIFHCFVEDNPLCYRKER
jgi:peptide methionine sulfoxide reductase MsrB